MTSNVNSSSSEDLLGIIPPLSDDTIVLPTSLSTAETEWDPLPTQRNRVKVPDKPTPSTQCIIRIKRLL